MKGISRRARTCAVVAATGVAVLASSASAQAQRPAKTGNGIPAGQASTQMFNYGGGGGWGNPLDRDTQAVLDDVLDEYVSVEGARRDYGVVLTGSLEDLTLEIDHQATSAKRATMRL